MATLYSSERHKLEQFTIGKTYPWRIISEGTNTVLYQSANRTVHTRRVKPAPAELLWQGTTYSHRMTRRQTPMLDVNGYIGSGDFYGPQGYLYRGSVGFEVFTGGVGESDPKSIRCDASVFGLPPTLSSNDLRNLLGDQKLDVLTGLVEYKQTARLFVDIARPLMRDTLDYVRALSQEVDKLKRYARSGGVRPWAHSALGIPGVRLTKKLADLHLAYVFGVKPLLGELTGAFELLTEGEPRPIVKASRQLRVITTASDTYVGDPPLRLPYTTTHRVLATRRYIVYGELEPVTSWRQFARLGMNPFSTAWEVLPWSFAIDRFIQIGSALQAMGAFTGITRATAYETLRVRKESTCTALNQVCSELERSTSRSKPSLNWVAPTVINNFGERQVVTYTALARQQLSKFHTMFK